MRSVSPPRHRNDVPSRGQPTCCAGFVGVARREALEVDAAVDDLGLAGGLGNRRSRALAQPARDGDDGGGPPHDVSRRGRGAWKGADVRNVLTMGGDDERGTGGERGGEAGRREEVGVDDVRPESPRGSDRVACEPR